MSKQQPEFALQRNVAEYLSRQYPGVLFLSDARAFLKLTIPQAVRSKSVQKDGFACPDMMLFEPRKGFCGLFLELKAATPYCKDGRLKSGEHLQDQQAAIDALNAKGYHADFAWDFDLIVAKLKWYLT